MSYTDGIGNLHQAAGSIPESRQAQQTKDAVTDTTRNEAVGTARADHAELSRAGGLISKALLEHSDVRLDKVQALRQAIASGSYQVSASDVADKLIETLTN